MTQDFPVRKVARLASLGLTAEEEQQLAREFGRILELVARVQALPLEGVPPSVHALAPAMRLEPDVPRPGLDREAALDLAPAEFEGHFRTPPILPGRAEE